MGQSHWMTQAGESSQVRRGEATAWGCGGVSQGRLQEWAGRKTGQKAECRYVLRTLSTISLDSWLLQAAWSRTSKDQTGRSVSWQDQLYDPAEPTYLLSTPLAVSLIAVL